MLGAQPATSRLCGLHQSLLLGQQARSDSTKLVPSQHQTWEEET